MSKTIGEIQELVRSMIDDVNGRSGADYLNSEQMKIIEETEQAIEALIAEAIAEERERVVVDYTDFLIEYSYVDSDVYAEEPKAVERYLTSLDKPTAIKLKGE